MAKDDSADLKLGLGCVACILTFLEGILLVYNFFDINIFQTFDTTDRSPTASHAFGPTQMICLRVLGVGDLVLAVVGAFGLWSCRNVFLSLVFDTLRDMHSQIAISCLRMLLVWRIVVTILAAPFLGMSLAFTPAHMIWHYCLAFLYLAASVAVSVALTFAWGAVTVESRFVQLEFDLEDAALRSRMGDFQTGQVEPLICGRLPWTPLIFFWIMLLGVIAFIYSVRLWTEPNCIIGGWAVMFRKLHFVPSTHWLEIVLYNLGWVMAVVGIAGIMIFNSSMSLEGLVQQTLTEPNSDPLARRDLFWELERAAAGKWQGSVCMYCYLVFSVLRVSLFFPLTGMALFQHNVCGFYVTALSRNYQAISNSRSTPLFCDSDDVRGLVWLGIFLVLDLTFTRGVYKVWRHYNLQCAVPKAEAMSLKGSARYGSYGAAQDVRRPPSLPSTRSAPPSPPREPLPEPPPAPEELEVADTGLVGEPAAQDDNDSLCPGVPPLPTNFLVALDSFRKLSAGIYPVPVLAASGETLLHMRLPSTPVQGYAVGGRGAWLELAATETARQPQASIGPLPRGVRKRRAAEIRGRAGESYGELTPVKSGWEVMRRGRSLLIVSSVNVQTMDISASLPDGSIIAKASAPDGENLELFVDAGNDTLLVLLCVLAVILMSPRPSMLLQRLPSATAAPPPPAEPEQPERPERPERAEPPEPPAPVPSEP